MELPYFHTHTNKIELDFFYIFNEKLGSLIVNKLFRAIGK